ncbi:MAG: tRNA 2-selenouridine(34) synthase MnmH [Flavobacteriales bacterium]
MPTAIPIEGFLRSELPLIDVRSPSEFAQGHIPRAVNLPLFTDEERSVVGTLYKQRGRDVAMLEGLRIAGPKLAGLVESARLIAPDGNVGVHCWRGGERSATVGWLLEKTASMKVLTLQKGYKAFRKLVLDSFGRNWNLRILGGYTGSGKTELLQKLRGLGEQTLDLEGLANHKGSAYGGIGAGMQPSTEQFENLIWDSLRRFDPRRPIWVEDESRLVGFVKIPDLLYAQMRANTVEFVNMPVEQRTARLVEEYGALPKEELAAATTRIQKRLGPQHAQEALAALAADDLHRVAMITLTYYDKTYARGLGERDPASIHMLDVNDMSIDDLARKLAERK